MCSELYGKFVQILHAEVVKENVIRRIAAKHSTFSLFLNLFNYFDHNISQVDISFLFVTVLHIHELTKSHLSLIRWHRRFFAWLTHSWWRASKLFNSLFTTERTINRTNQTTFETWSILRSSSWTSQDRSCWTLNILSITHSTARRLDTSWLHSLLLVHFELFSSHIKLHLKNLYFFTKRSQLRLWVIAFWFESLHLSLH